MAPEKPAFDPALLVLYASSPRFDAVLSLEFQQNTLLIIMEYSNDRIFIPLSSSQKESKLLLVNEKEKEKKEV